MPINPKEALEVFKRKFAQEYKPTVTTTGYIHDVDTDLRYNIDAIRYSVPTRSVEIPAYTIDAGKIQKISFCDDNIPFAFYYEPESTNDCTEILDLLSDT